MKWFSEFGSFGIFTIAFLVIALAGGLLALIKKEHAKRIMVVTGVLAGTVLIVALIAFACGGSITGGVFDGIGVGSGIFTSLVVVLLIAMVAIMVISGRKNRWTARDMANAAMCVAMSFILSYIKLFTMPQGGTITPASMLPIILFTVAFGPARGMVVGCAYGLLQLFQGAYVIHPIQMLVDYPMAFGAIALGGVVNYIRLPDYAKLPAAVLMAFIGRYIMAVLSGVIFFAEYAGEQNAMIYSLIYNVSYLLPDCLVCMAVSLIPGFGRLTRALAKR